MRHRKTGRNLGRMSAHRELMFRNMMSSLFEHEIIKTTLPKAKELRRFAERMITLSKEDSVANRRLAFARLRNKATVSKLFDVIGPASLERHGGYLRVLKCGFRQNDASPMAIVEMVDRETFSNVKPKPEKPKRIVKEKKEKKPAKKTVEKTEKVAEKKEEKAKPKKAETKAKKTTEPKKAD